MACLDTSFRCTSPFTNVEWLLSTNVLLYLQRGPFHRTLQLTGPLSRSVPELELSGARFNGSLLDLGFRMYHSLFHRMAQFRSPKQQGIQEGDLPGRLPGSRDLDPN